jgi:hypothetical protein
MTTSNRATKEAMWAERVSAWKESGESTEVFARGRGFSGSSLRNWTRRLAPSKPPRFLKLVPKASAVAPPPTLLVEIGEAKVRVVPGFDPSLLEQVVRALGGGRR